MIRQNPPGGERNLHRLCQAAQEWFAESHQIVYLGINMPEQKKLTDSRGRTWTISKVSWEEAEEVIGEEGAALCLFQPS